jgi:hypothetical protein
MEATCIQTPQLLTVDRQGFAFRKTDLIPIDNKPEIQEDSLLGRYTIRTHWSESGTQLISDISFRTKDSRDAQMRSISLRDSEDYRRVLEFWHFHDTNIINCVMEFV